MTRQIAVEYIKKTRALGFADAVLRKELEKSGWPASEIDLAFIESRAVDQKPAIEPPPAQFAPRTQPQWEDQKAQTFNTEPKPIDLTKSSFVRPAQSSPTTTPPKPLGTPSGTIGLQFNPPPKQVPIGIEKQEEKPSFAPHVSGESQPVQSEVSTQAPRIAEIKKTFVTPENELKEPDHLKELPRTGTPDSPKAIPLDTKISEVKKLTSEPLIMGVPESQLIRPTPRPEPQKITPTQPPKIEQQNISVQQPVEKLVTNQEFVAQSPQFKPMQEEVVSDLVGSVVGAEPSATRSPVLESMGIPPRTRSKRTLATVMAVATFFVASGAAAGFWYYETSIKPQKIVHGALLAAQTMKSYKYDTELQMKIRESDATLGSAVRPFVPPLAGFALGAMTAGSNSADDTMNYSFTMRAKGAVDMHDPAKPKSEATLTLGTKDLIFPGFPNSNTEFESRLVDDTYYFQVTKLPYFDSATVDPSIPRFTSADVTGRWVSINFDTFENDFNNYAKELSELEPSFVGYHLDLKEEGDLITEKKTKDIQKLWDETRLIVWKDEIIREQEGGVDVYRVKGMLDKDSFKQFMIKSAEMTGGAVGDMSDDVVSDLFSGIGDVEINAWVTKSSGQLARFSVKAASMVPDETGREGVVEFHLTTDLSDIDKPMSIAAPTEHYDVRNLLEKLFAYAREGFASDNADARDARRLSDLSRIRTALELYKKREGNYPDKLTSLVSEYLAVVPSDPLTKKSYRYTRTAKGYTLSAQLENTKHPILKQDINPANTLYDIGPAL